MMRVLRMTPVLQLERFAKHLKALAGGESGAAGIFFVLSAPVWIGALALGAEVGNWYYQRQQLQLTADVMASSVASRIGAAPTQDELDYFFNVFLTRNNFSGDASISLAAPPGPVFVDGNTVTVTLRKPIKRYFSKIFKPGELEIETTASAQVTMATQGCILGLDLNENIAVDVGLSNVTVTGCEVLSNGNSLRVGVSAALTTDCARSRNAIAVLGALNVTCRNGQPEREAGVTLDPYIDLPDLDVSDIPCDDTQSDPIVITISNPNWNDYFTPVSRNGRNYVRLCAPRSLTINAPTGTVSIPNSTFIFDEANLRIDDTNVIGGASSFYFMKGGRAIINALNKRVTLRGAAAEGNILFRGARANGGVINQINVGPSSNLQGAIYFPSSDIQFRASGNVSGCLQIIGRAVNLLQGTWQMTGPCNVANLLRPIVASRTVRLTQ